MIAVIPVKSMSIAERKSVRRRRHWVSSSLEQGHQCQFHRRSEFEKGEPLKMGPLTLVNAPLI